MLDSTISNNNVSISSLKMNSLPHFFFNYLKHKDQKQNENFIFGQITYFLKQKLFGCFLSVLFNLIAIIEELTSGHLRKISANICVCATTMKIFYIFNPNLLPRTLIWIAAWIDLPDIYLVSC